MSYFGVLIGQNNSTMIYIFLRGPSIWRRAMSKVKSETVKKGPDVFDLLLLSDKPGYKTTITDGTRTATGSGDTPEQAQAEAKYYWERLTRDDDD